MTKFTYVKSTLTGQVYRIESLPEFTFGWELTTREAYVNWCIRTGIKPEADA